MMITIVGLGGIGKTALAHEIIQQGFEWLNIGFADLYDSMNHMCSVKFLDVKAEVE